MVGILTMFICPVSRPWPSSAPTSYMEKRDGRKPRSFLKKKASYWMLVHHFLSLY